MKKKSGIRYGIKLKYHITTEWDILDSIQYLSPSQSVTLVEKL